MPESSLPAEGHFSKSAYILSQNPKEEEDDALMYPSEVYVCMHAWEKSKE
jgi:hypothetical protein